MANRYGQTDMLAQYLAAQPKQHHTGLGTALRLAGAGVAAYGQHQKQKQQQTALADALRGLNTGALGADGPTMAAAAQAPVADPEGMATLLSNGPTQGIGQAMLAKALKGPDKGELVKAADGYLYNSVTGARAFPDVQQAQDPQLKSVHGVGLVDVTDPANPRLVQAEGRRAPSTSVNVNTGNPNALAGLSKLPAGMTYLYGPNGQVQRDERGVPMVTALPGSKQALAEAESEKKEAGREEDKQRQADIMLQDIDTALRIVDEATIPVTGAGALLNRIPGTAANDLRSTLDTIKGNISFDRLNAMRANSPTGGALGNVTEGELSLLSAAYGSVEQSQSAAQFIANMNRLRALYAQVVHGTEPVDTVAPGGGWSVERID